RRDRGDEFAAEGRLVLPGPDRPRRVAPADVRVAQAGRARQPAGRHLELDRHAVVEVAGKGPVHADPPAVDGGGEADVLLPRLAGADVAEQLGGRDRGGRGRCGDRAQGISRAGRLGAGPGSCSEAPEEYGRRLQVEPRMPQYTLSL